MHTQIILFICVLYVYMCVLRQFISIRFVDVTEMSNESQIVLYYQINDDENIYFYRNVLDVDTDISFFTFFVSVNDVSRLVLFSLISSASTKFYTLRHENRLQWRCIAIGCRFFKMSKNFCREWSLQLQLDEWKILNFCPWSYHTDKL